MNAARRTTKTDHPRDFFISLARVIEHYLPEERTRYRHCGRATRTRHIYRDLQTLERSLRGWLNAATILSEENLLASLFSLAKEFAEVANGGSEHLNYEEHANLCEYEIKFLAFANLLSARNLRQFLAGELAEATEYLNDIRERLGLAEAPPETEK